MLGESIDHPRGQTVDFVVEQIRQGIFAGRFVPGQRLVARDVTDEIGISRGPIREAFRRLAADGLIELVPNRGAAVRRLSRREVRELFQIRENLEGLAARLAAENINAPGRRELFSDVWKQVRPTRRPQQWHTFIQQNRLYHRTIVAIGDNAQLAELIDRLQLPVMMFQIGQAMRPENAALSHEDHVRVAKAILAGEPTRAEEAMRAHLRRSYSWVTQLPDWAFKKD